MFTCEAYSGILQLLSIFQGASVNMRCNKIKGKKKVYFELFRKVLFCFYSCPSLTRWKGSLVKSLKPSSHSWTSFYFALFNQQAFIDYSTIHLQMVWLLNGAKAALPFTGVFAVQRSPVMLAVWEVMSLNPRELTSETTSLL